MNTNEIHTRPNLSPLAFWDVDFRQIDFENKSLFVMEKVFNYGIWSDMIELIRFYGKERIKKDIINATYLHKEVMNFICFYFDLSPDDFQCSTYRQSNSPHWTY